MGLGGSGFGGDFVLPDASTAGGGTASSSADGQVVACTGGDECVCPPFNVAVIGKPGQWGAASTMDADSDTAFQDWLNSSSAGTAKVDVFTNRPTLSADFLATYNVIILASLSDDSNLGPWWTFDAAEVAAVQDWVTNLGGGIITLTGYAGNGAEVNPTNQLIAFSGLAYNQDWVSLPCALPNGACWCGGSSPITQWNKTDPVVANLSFNVTMVGVQNGRAINAPADAHVAATTSAANDAVNPVNVLVGKIVGKGRVLVFTDEWITYTSQWNGQGNPNSTNPACVGALPQDVYQTAQFWYNMIKWVQPSATCFTIVDNQQPVVTWPPLL
jgi:hypothetical protein